MTQDLTVFKGEVLQTSDQLCGPSLDPIYSFTSFLFWVITPGCNTPDGTS